MKGKLITATLLAIVTAAGTISCSKKTDTQTVPGKQTTCPVMKGKAINPDMYVDVNGKRIYLCCPGCIAPIKAEPDKYIGEMEAAGIILEDAPTAEQK